MNRWTLSLPMRREGFDDPGFVREAAQAAEAAGCWGITAPDHIVAPNKWARAGGGERWPDPFVLLGFIAGVTTTLRLITHIIVLPYRHPLAVAKAIASLDRLSDGRAVLGVGSGYLREEFEILGADFENRGRVTDEAIRTIRSCWTEGDIPGFDARLAPQPVQAGGPPVWIGGNSLRALRRAVELGDCWAPFDVTDEQLRTGIARAEQLGRRVEIAAPLGRVQPTDGVEAVRARLEQLQAIGVDIIKIALGGDTREEWLTNFAWFADALGR